MSTTITIRDIEPRDKSWLKREARHVGVSMEEFVRRLIREKRVKTERRPKPSEVFGRHVGPEHGIELPRRGRYGYKPVELIDGTGT